MMSPSPRRVAPQTDLTDVHAHDPDTHIERQAATPLSDVLAEVCKNLALIAGILVLGIITVASLLELRDLYADVFQRTSSDSLFNVFKVSYFDSMLCCRSTMFVGYWVLSTAAEGEFSFAASLSFALAVFLADAPWDKLLYYVGLKVLWNATKRHARAQELDNRTAILHMFACFAMHRCARSGLVTSLLALATHAFFRRASWMQIQDAVAFFCASDARTQEMLTEGRPFRETMLLLPFINHSDSLDNQRQQLIQLRDQLRAAVIVTIFTLYRNVSRGLRNALN